MIFQDPDSTLNPRQRVRTLLDRSIRRLGDNAARQDRQRRAVELLASVDLDSRYLDALPSELSGGQRQRVAIARAFAGAPALVLCDEPTSALDASVQATILNLLDRLQRDQGTAYLFISHDIDVVRYLSDYVGVLYLGRLMQFGSVERVFAPPFHPYTEVLLGSVPGRGKRSHPGHPRRWRSSPAAAWLSIPVDLPAQTGLGVRDRRTALARASGRRRHVVPHSDGRASGCSDAVTG